MPIISGGQTTNATYPYRASVMKSIKRIWLLFLTNIFFNSRERAMSRKTSPQGQAKYRDTLIWPKMKQPY